MAAFLAKQIVGDQFSAVKGELSKKSAFAKELADTNWTCFQPISEAPRDQQQRNAPSWRRKNENAC